MDDDGLYFSIIVFGLPFDCVLSSDLYRLSIFLDWPAFNDSEWAYEVIDIVGHSCGGMDTKPNKKVIRVHL